MEWHSVRPLVLFILSAAKCNRCHSWLYCMPNQTRLIRPIERCFKVVIGWDFGWNPKPLTTLKWNLLIYSYTLNQFNYSTSLPPARFYWSNLNLLFTFTLKRRWSRNSLFMNNQFAKIAVYPKKYWLLWALKLPYDGNITYWVRYHQTKDHWKAWSDYHGEISTASTTTFSEVTVS